jgi:hypothetical protein
VPDRRAAGSHGRVLATIELAADGDATRLTYTEQPAFFDPAAADSFQAHMRNVLGSLHRNRPGNTRGNSTTPV